MTGRTPFPQQPGPGQPAAALSVEIIFDGGALGNPGEGYGSYRLTVGEAAPQVKRLRFGRTTNNEAEYRALIEALEAATAALAAQSADPGQAHLTVRGDSRLVLEQVSGKWKVRAPHLLGLRDRAAALLERFGKVDLRWQPRAASVRILGH